MIAQFAGPNLTNLAYAMQNKHNSYFTAEHAEGAEEKNMTISAISAIPAVNERTKPIDFVLGAA